VTLLQHIFQLAVYVPCIPDVKQRSSPKHYCKETLELKKKYFYKPNVLHVNVVN